MSVKLYFLKEDLHCPHGGYCELTGVTEIDGETYYVMELKYRSGREDFYEVFNDCRKCLTRVRNKSVGEYIVSSEI